MKSFWQFAFSFLYVRNWHTGHMELSRARFSLFLGGIFLIMLAITIVVILQAPVEYRTS